MIIADVQITHLSIPLKVSFKTSLRTVTHLDDLLVQIVTDQGVVGQGSAAAATYITGEIY